MRNFSCPIKWSRNNNKDYLFSHHKTLVIACVRYYKQIIFLKAKFRKSDVNSRNFCRTLHDTTLNCMVVVETTVVLNNPTSISDLTIFDIPRNVITKWNIQLRKEPPFNPNLHVTKTKTLIYPIHPWSFKTKFNICVIFLEVDTCT